MILLSLCRLCEPIVDYFTQRGGQLHTNSRLQEFQLAEDGSIAGLRLANGQTITGDLYVSAMPGIHEAELQGR